MTGPLVPEILRGERVTLVPFTPADADSVVAIILEPSVRAWWPVESERALREEILDAACPAWTIRLGGAVAGWIQACEETWPGYRSVGVDIVIACAQQDRGLGTEALRLLIRFLLDECGHHRVTIDPAADNVRAVHVYEKVGFRPIGIARAYERRVDGTHRDALLMDLLAGEET